MPFTDLAGPRDAIQDTFRVAWEAQPPPVPLVLYQDLDGEPPKDGNVEWARITVAHSDSRQVTLGRAGGRRFRRLGIVTIQVFTPSGGGLTRSDTLAKVAVDAFEGKSTGGGDTVDFKNVRPIEVGQDGKWHQTNVVAEFEYDEVK